MTENTGNFISKFAPQSYFFTTPGAISQSAAQAFGPVSPDEFRLTSKFSIAANSMAYAICKGIAFVQPQTEDASKVNIVLRPFTQPIQGFNIKYFIYRGLTKGDFFAGANVLSTGSDFVTKANTDFTDYYNSAYPGETVPAFLAKYIGFDPDHQADTLLIDDFFFKQATQDETSGQEQTDLAFELPLVQGGSSLGNFAAGECGLDVVISWGDYKLPQPNDEFVFDLAYARTDEYTLDLSDETDEFKKKQIREQIFQFLDAAAYFGFHANDGGAVKLKSGNTETTKKADQVYTDLLQGFNTKNNLYLYIQSDRTRSYNFYGNYNIDDSINNSLKLGITDAALTERAYETNGWPLIIDTTPQTHDDSRNRLYLQLVTDNNPNTMLYGQVAVIDNAQSNNFCGIVNLLSQSFTGLTNVITLSNPSIVLGSNKMNVASFNILIYKGTIYTASLRILDSFSGDEDFFDIPPKSYDDIFSCLGISLKFKGNSSSYSKVVSTKVELINVEKGILGAQMVIVNDEIDSLDSELPKIKRVFYFAECIDMLSAVTDLNGSVSSDTKSSSSQNISISGESMYRFPDGLYANIIVFTDGANSISGIDLKSQDGTLPNKIMVGLTSIENEILISLTQSNALMQVRLFLTEVDVETGVLTSLENISYQKYSLGVVGESDSGKLVLCLPSESLVIYSIDQRCYFSKTFSDRIVQGAQNDYNIGAYHKLNLVD